MDWLPSPILARVFKDIPIHTTLQCDRLNRSIHRQMSSEAFWRELLMLRGLSHKDSYGSTLRQLEMVLYRHERKAAVQFIDVSILRVDPGKTSQDPRLERNLMNVFDFVFYASLPSRVRPALSAQFKSIVESYINIITSKRYANADLSNYVIPEVLKARLREVYKKLHPFDILVLVPNHTLMVFKDESRLCLERINVHTLPDIVQVPFFKYLSKYYEERSLTRSMIRDFYSDMDLITGAGMYEFGDKDDLMQDRDGVHVHLKPRPRMGFHLVD